MKLTGSNCDGTKLTKGEQANALRHWFGGVSGLTASRLMRFMSATASDTGDGTPTAQMRNADSTVQKLRQAGVIEFDGKSWHLTDDYADDINHHIDSWLA